MISVQQILTGGEFATEAEAIEHLDREALRSGAFNIHREVSGFYLQPRCESETKGARIDRILTPTPKLFEAGWMGGPIGIECKTSGMKVGKVISQAMDYSRCVWQMPKGYLIVLRWVFVWPLERVTGDIESIMAQNRVGYCRAMGRNPLVFSCGGMNGITIGSDGSVVAKNFPMGGKTGSR